MRFASYTHGGDKYGGAITDEGVVALNDDFPQWPIHCLMPLRQMA